jgi:hypothetical protein
MATTQRRDRCRFRPAPVEWGRPVNTGPGLDNPSIGGASAAVKSTPHHAVEEACAHVQGATLKAQAAFLWKLINSPITRGCGNMHKRYWVGAVVVTAVLVIATLFLSRQSQEEKDLDTSLVRLQIATGEGITLTKFSELVLDVATKFELARPYLSSKKEKSTEHVVAIEQAAQTLWGLSIEYSQRCPQQVGCKAYLYPALKTMDLVKDEASYKTWASQTDWSYGNSAFVSQMLGIASLTVVLCVKYPDGCVT